MGRPAHSPTPEQREAVLQYVRDGITHEHIAVALGISPPTLRQHYRVELDSGEGEWLASFEKSIKARVLREDCPPALVIFTAKVKLGWRELTPKDPDKRIAADLTDDELASIVAQRARDDRERRGAGDPTPARRAA